MIDTLYTSPTYNSFMDVASADIIIPTRDALAGDSSGWSDLDEPTKEAHLIDATRIINNQDWAGNRNDDIVAPKMSWPRTDLLYVTGEDVPGDDIPVEVLDYMACIITSRLMYGDPEAVSDAEAVTSKTVGKVMVDYSDAASSGVAPTGADRCKNTYIPDIWLMTSSSVMGVGSFQKMRRP